MKKFNAFSDKLNIGSGKDYKEGWINIDSNPAAKPDILYDVEKGIPLKDNSVEFVLIKHVLEHIEPRKFGHVMSEIKRVCKNNALVKIYVPYFSCGITYITVDHLTKLSYYTFDHIDGFEILKKRLNFFRRGFGYQSKSMTIIGKILNPIFSFLPNAFPLIYERFFCWIFPMEELEVVLRIKK